MICLKHYYTETSISISEARFGMVHILPAHMSSSVGSFFTDLKKAEMRELRDDHDTDDVNVRD